MGSSSWRLLLGLYVVGLTVLAVMPTAGGGPAHLDKFVHVAQYVGLGWLVVQAIRFGAVIERVYLIWAWVFATSYGLLMEIIQLLVPWRSAEWADLLANASGVTLGVWIGQRVASKK